MPEPTRHDAGELESGYTTSHRLYEIGGMVLTTASVTWVTVLIAKCPPFSGWWIPLAMLLGLFFADFMSGFVHWMFVTWGSVDTPVFGRLAIRTFRHHHVDKKAITKHDFIETNGHNFGLGLPWMIGTGLYLQFLNRSTLFEVFMAMSLLAMVVFSAFTSQIHKWAHQNEADVPRVVRLLQRARLVLSPEHHDQHHCAPYNRSYCITVGWLNGPLRSIRFFETLEAIISFVTGAVPREDDIGKDLAIAVALENVEAAEPEPEAVIVRD